ncbi:anthranilate phosphoribosyltransferase [Clostridium formicaceticum]|uniref:Anthranilate phosphoribosyltransferase n=1 Tax=Clostridium formicaceticum TaxID=1497 RepID=A0AAC9RHX9_9CLOT|nr:anthranilate phosphoribosyltransferase [Clostridium formicaceticum]AOY75808.1 anthranilate phosphoribosyltransferase [Clostridium formicaceticum]ARE86137.1 Anthranilate phosphoribosyltransferase [Clostridium formicaceticum]
MIQFAIDKVIKRQHLTEEEMMRVMQSIMEGEATPSQIGGFLAALRMKGETVEEITGSARVMREKALKVDVEGCYAIDTCGTGGDHSNTFNISTTVAFIAAAAGVTVVKHGNRSVTSSCGSADVLEKLGVNIQLTPEEVKRCVEELNIGFMFAPNFHQAMKHAVLPRRELGIRTIFNILGPLTNPAAVQGQVLGVFDDSLTEIMAEVLLGLGVERAMVVHGFDGLDEITITDKTKVSELKDKKVTTYAIDPRKFDIPLAGKQEIQGGNVEENAEILLNVLRGERGGKRNMVLLNAGAAIYVGKAANSLEEGIDQAREVIDMGLALDKLHQLIAFSQEMKQ